MLKSSRHFASTRGLLAGAAILFLFLVGPGGAAANVQISNLGKGQISVDVVDASLDEVLNQIGSLYGFKVERIGNAAPSDTMSGRFDGTLAGVVARVLQSENHSIVTSSTAPSGIVRVSLYSSGPAVQAAAPNQQQFASTAGGGPQPLSRLVPAPQPAAARAPPVAQPYTTLPSATRSAATTSAPRGLVLQQPVSAPAEALQRRRGGVIN